jgi:hypothetical protein
MIMLREVEKLVRRELGEGVVEGEGDEVEEQVVVGIEGWSEIQIWAKMEIWWV